MMPLSSLLYKLNLERKIKRYERKIWKDVVGYEGLYKVSSYGDIISYQNKVPRHIYQTTTNCGYKQVSLHNNGHRKQIGVHI